MKTLPGWTRWFAALGALASAMASTARGAEDLALFPTGEGFRLKSARMEGATASEIQVEGRPALRLVTAHQTRWPGITLPAPEGRWDLSSFERVSVDVRNAGTNTATIYCRVDNPGANGTDHCVTDSIQLDPGKAGTLRVKLRRDSNGKLDGRLFGMRGYPAVTGGPGTVVASNITQLVVFVSEPHADHVIEVGSIRASGTPVAATARVTDAEPYLPLIDTFGQYRHRDWPGKTHSAAELVARQEAEARELALRPGPADRGQFGGWAAGPRLRASGFFRAEKYKDRWWLVDPDGLLFWSQGINCVRMLDYTPVEERMDWFADFPGSRPEFREFFAHAEALMGHYAGRRPECFSFAGANLARKYGMDWRNTYPGWIHRRLRSWGLNTIGNWSDAQTVGMRRTAYTDTVDSSGARNIEGSEGYWGKFPDVYDAGFAAAVRRSVAGKKGHSAGDPWCLGFFSDNEMSWGDDVSLALAALRSPADQAAKRAFVAELRDRHGSIGSLNARWGSRHESWEALLASRDLPNRERARADLTSFYSKTAERYFRVVREILREVAPNQMYLGCRFAWANELAAKAAGVHCDVVSYNVYRRSVADFRYPGPDRPLLIGEFHFGSLDRGLFHPGLVPVESQKARAEAYREYVLGAARHPQMVGVHWFQWQDEPTMGRAWDEENYQIGFVDVADTPYEEIIQASREVANRLYAERGGR